MTTEEINCLAENGLANMLACLRCVSEAVQVADATLIRVREAAGKLPELGKAVAPATELRDATAAAKQKADATADALGIAFEQATKQAE